MDRSLVLLKPDAVQRGLVGELIGRLERKGLKVAALKMMTVDDALARRHYEAHVGKPFFAGLIEFISSSPLVALVVEGERAVAVVRGLMGATDPVDATPGTIRGDLALTIGMNLVHGSDSDEAAVKEIDLFFTPDEISSYDKELEAWITES